MRPRGEIRLAVQSAAHSLIDQRGCCTPRDVAHAAQVALKDAWRTLGNIIDAGELVVVGKTKVPGANRPVNLLARPDAATASQAGADLFRVVHSWADFR